MNQHFFFTHPQWRMCPLAISVKSLCGEQLGGCEAFCKLVVYDYMQNCLKVWEGKTADSHRSGCSARTSRWFVSSSVMELSRLISSGWILSFLFFFRFKKRPSVNFFWHEQKNLLLVRRITCFFFFLNSLLKQTQSLTVLFSHHNSYFYAQFIL